MDGQSAEHINRTLLPLKVILKKFTARMDGWVPELMDGHSARWMDKKTESLYKGALA